MRAGTCCQVLKGQVYMMGESPATDGGVMVWTDEETEQ